MPSCGPNDLPSLASLDDLSRRIQCHNDTRNDFKHTLYGNNQPDGILEFDLVDVQIEAYPVAIVVVDVSLKKRPELFYNF
jgi:hypothetical protein